MNTHQIDSAKKTAFEHNTLCFKSPLTQKEIVKPYLRKGSSSQDQYKSVKNYLRVLPFLFPSLYQCGTEFPVNVVLENSSINLLRCGSLIDRDSVFGTATRYVLDGPEIESRWRRDFSHPPRTTLGPTYPPIQ